MDYAVKAAQADSVKTDCVIVGIFEKNDLSAAARQIDRRSNGFLSRLLKQGDIIARVGSGKIIHNVPNIGAARVLAVGCGAAGKITAGDYQAICSGAAQSLKSSGAAEAVSFLHEIEVQGLDQERKLRQAVIHSEEALYRFDKYKQQQNKSRLQKLVFGFSAGKPDRASARALVTGSAIAHGMSLTRNLGDLPANVCTPSYLAQRARALSKRYPSVKTTVLETAQMRKLGMGSLLAVAQGSKQPPKLIIMQYRQGNPGAKPVVLVGKGITFDTGGISIKPAQGMEEMKFDMCGAASVIGTMAACAQMKLRANLIGVIAAAENMPGGGATRPGDIVTSMSGRTIEIINTDAEGRLVLCDALTYVERYQPAAVIDIATLTGACVIALGRFPSGLFGNNSELIEALKSAGQRSWDRVWELPLWSEYKPLLNSSFADLANVGNRDGGAITAATFLAHFTEKYPWAHLDIAGTAWKSGSDKGATGRPVPLLTEYILSNHT
ncbi:MAG TPA: leucyl aminopeptidase [Gammaproteobacteria bacterium]|nr:leucyl aminopeptidase [Gammaproteobacteria bacterium]